jgi:hypothetical protein
MINKEHSKGQDLPAATHAPEVSPKPEYTTPELRFFGSVTTLTASGQGSGADGGSTMAMQSDINCKQNIVKVGELACGVGLYLFDYKPEFTLLPTGRQFGVLAQEVETVMPTAVSIAANGYKQVDYHMLGISHIRH